ncbi:hypothetical protein [uncultured Xanthomonas sp.]|uniref:hypothetical protein n=1 Tax=uncultured Xanthomonas sp. TaxID=152831 RepID=UPI0025D15975|nr:hypothetical protein [uncultured Xanthomonas sp.]
MVVFLAVDEVEAMRSPMGEGITVAVAVAVAVAAADDAVAGAGAGAGAVVAVVSAVAVVLAFDLPGSLPKRRPARGKTPKGRRTWMYAVRGRGRMPLPRIPGLDAHPEREARRARRQGVLSFGYFSLHKQRKVTRRQAKAFALD